MANKRIFWGETTIGFNHKDDDPKVVFNEDRSSVGFQTDFPTLESDPTQIDIYENIEPIPELVDEYKDIFISKEALDSMKNWNNSIEKESAAGHGNI
jgi:hypothetical protein